MWRDVCEDYSESTKSEQIALFESVKQDLFPEELDKMTKLQIHIYTFLLLFYWRHKILNALGSLGFNQLQGIIESDETFFRKSLKGKSKLTHRKTKKRGSKDKKAEFLTLKLQL